MEMFRYHLDLIDKMGFSDWIKTYPVNPFTIYPTLIIIAIIIIVVIIKGRNKKAQGSKPLGAATLVLSKRNAFDSGLADNVKVLELNEKKVKWFYHKNGSAIYLAPGTNDLKVLAKWSYRKGKKIITNESQPLKIRLFAERDKEYSINYDITHSRYIFTEGCALEDDKWKNSLTEKNIVG